MQRSHIKVADRDLISILMIYILIGYLPYSFAVSICARKFSFVIVQCIILLDNAKMCPPPGLAFFIHSIVAFHTSSLVPNGRILVACWRIPRCDIMQFLVLFYSEAC